MKKSLALLALVFGMTPALFSQTPITGTISDANGKALMGATIIIEGVLTGCIADAKGNYELTAPAKAKKLVVSCAGYQPQKIAIGKETKIDVVLVQQGKKGNSARKRSH